ncbi:hypothetical protein YPPY05_0931, partial [Yersinia pestis PY-05]
CLSSPFQIESSGFVSILKAADAAFRVLTKCPQRREE